MWRFYERHGITFKERAKASRGGPRATLDAETGHVCAPRLGFIDETCTSTAVVRLRGRSPRGERLVGYAPHAHRKTITFVAALRQRGMTAPLVLDGAMKGQCFLPMWSKALLQQSRRYRLHGQSADA
jgi:hypothetical protein